MVVLVHGNRYYSGNGHVTCRNCNCEFVYSAGDAELRKRFINWPPSTTTIIETITVRCPECQFLIELGDMVD